MTNINTRICEVTIYTNQALITRRGKVLLTGEERELVITGLPLSIQTESVRVRGLGTADVRLLEVRIENVFDSESFSEKVTQISQKIRYLEQQKRTLQDQLATFQLQRNFVEGLSEKSLERYSGSLANPHLDLNEIRELVSFLGEQYGEYANAISQRERQVREIEKQLEIFIQQIKQFQKPNAKESYSNNNAIVAIETTGAGEFEIELSYLVDRVIWVPVYDVRTSSSCKQFHITYLAEIKQKTGEDWTDVKLNLSTAKPVGGIVQPKLEPWYITGRRNDLFVVCNSENNEDDFAELEALLAEDNDTGGKPNLPLVKKTTKYSGAVTFNVDTISNIPNDGAAYKVTLLRGDFIGNTEYVAIPRSNCFAYLEATIKNISNAVMLPGKANIFRDNALIGTTQLDIVAPGDKFKINLGTEENLKIERDLVEREVELMGNYRRITYKYKVVIRNFKDEKISLRLIEQLPVSRDEKIKVRLLSTCPKIQLGKMGELEWLLTLQGRSKRSCKREIYYQFIVEHPSEISVVSLDI